MSNWKHTGFTMTPSTTFGGSREHQLVGSLALTGTSGYVGAGIALTDYATGSNITESLGKTLMTTPSQILSNDFKNENTGEKFQIYYDGVDSETHVWSKNGKITKMRHY